MGDPNKISILLCLTVMALFLTYQGLKYFTEGNVDFNEIKTGAELVKVAAKAGCADVTDLLKNKKG